jgi:hypothetical protein
MGQAKNRKRSYDDLLKNYPFCIFCGGETPAVTVDHIPAKVMFDGSLRPKGLEFSACEACNHGARKADLAAAWLGRIYPDAKTQMQKDDIVKLLRSISNNFPELLIEMKMGRGAQKIGMKKLPNNTDGGLLRANGPLLTKYMNIFSLKLGLALHFETTKRIVGQDGGIAIRWFSNFEKFTGDFPDEITDIMGPSQTLQNGSNNVAGQFDYAWRVSEDGGLGMYFASFRMSFAIWMAVALDKTILQAKQDKEGLKIFTSFDMKQMLELEK